MVLVFDLDDTLYNELTYVYSGFRAVADYLYQNHGIPSEPSLQFMAEKLQSGRGRIFDDLLRHYGIYQKKIVRKCLTIYRTHQPNIVLDPDAIACLERFRHYSLYIVTDGNKLVQYNKLKALSLDKYVKFCYITHRYGIKNAKPSLYCFQKICTREKVAPKEVVYIADNLNKDFIGIKPLGFKTIRVMKGQYKDIKKPPEFEADYRISSLDELDEGFLAKVGSDSGR